jgi:hypothetical protein
MYAINDHNTCTAIPAAHSHSTEQQEPLASARGLLAQPESKAHAYLVLHPAHAMKSSLQSMFAQLMCGNVAWPPQI